MGWASMSPTRTTCKSFFDVKAGLVIGPNIGQAAPVASYWFYHSQLYREAKYVVISRDDYPLGWRRGAQPASQRRHHRDVVLNGIAGQILAQGLARPAG